MVRRVERQGEILMWYRKCLLSLCETENGTEIDELLQAGASEHKRAWTMLKRIEVLEDGRVPSNDAKHWKIKRQKRRITTKEYQRHLNKFGMEGFVGQKRLESRKKQSFARQRCRLGKKATQLESIRQCMKRIS